MNASPDHEPSLATLQNVVSGTDREAIASAIAYYTNTVRPNRYTGAHSTGPLEQLATTGIVRMPFRVPEAACKDLVDYFLATPCHNAHSVAYGDGSVGLPLKDTHGWPYGSYTLEQTLKAPALIELALKEELLDLIGGYLGCLPTLYSINTFWTFPRPEAGVTHKYHRDEDDYRFLAVFVFWTDVSVGEGDFVFVPETHTAGAIRRRSQRQSLRFWQRKDGLTLDHFRRSRGSIAYEDDESFHALISPSAQRFDGPAGTVHCGDTFGIHKGTPPATKPRLSTWLRYGLGENMATGIDKAPPLPVDILGGRVTLDEQTRHICRLLIR